MSKEANEVILEVKGLKKNFGSNQVLKGVDISIKKGEVECGEKVRHEIR